MALDPTLADATSQLAALATGRISALELLEAALSRRHEVDQRLTAVVAVDPQPAVARARLMDERRLASRRAGEDPDALGLLAGLPMTVKDTFDVDGMPASAGLARLKARLASDADVVGRVKAAGGNIWGKTNATLADWRSANALYGATANPWRFDRTPGGSSGGAAAAVAAGITALEIGSDIGGSLRIPASFCGVFSHKPTHGVIAMRGHVPPGPDAEAEPDLAVAGPIARSARDLRLLLSVLSPAPIPARAPRADLVGLKVGVWTEDPAFVLDPAVRRRVLAFAEASMDAGVQVRIIESPVNGAALLDVYAVLLLAQVRAAAPLHERLGWELLRGPAGLARNFGAGPLSWAGQVRGATARHREWLAASEARARLKRIAALTFEEHDVVIAPAAPLTAFPHDRTPFGMRSLTLSDGTRAPYPAMLHWQALATVLGLPATTVPIGLAADGLPVGAQIIGPEGGDSKTLAVAEALEEVAAGFAPPPLDRLIREAAAPPETPATKRAKR